MRSPRWMFAVVAAALLAAACGAGGTSRPESEEGPLVVASFYPLAFAAQHVAGDLARVEDLTPPGVEPHDLELSPRQVRLLHDADLLLYLGAGFQPAVDDVARGLGSVAVDVLDAVEVMSTADAGPGDPHVWLDPRRMQDITRSVAEHLRAADPGNASAYERNADALVSLLGDLDDEMRRGLRRCENRVLIVSHEAFGYLAVRYGLDQRGIAGLDPEAEPSPRRLAEAIRFARAHDVRTIFFETLVSPAVAETVAREIGAATAVLDPLESAPSGGDYIDAMRANLDALRSGLNCP